MKINAPTGLTALLAAADIIPTSQAAFFLKIYFRYALRRNSPAGDFH